MKRILKHTALSLLCLFTVLCGPTDSFAANETEVSFTIDLEKSGKDLLNGKKSWTVLTQGSNSESAWKIKEVNGKYILYNNMNTPDTSGYLYQCPLRIKEFSFDVGVDSTLKGNLSTLEHYHIAHGELGKTSEGNCGNQYQDQGDGHKITCCKPLDTNKCPLCNKPNAGGQARPCPKDTLYFDDDDCSFVLINCKTKTTDDGRTKVTGYVIVLSEGNGQTYSGASSPIQSVYYNCGVPNGIYYLNNCTLTSSNLAHKEGDNFVTNTKEYVGESNEGYLVAQFQQDFYPVYGAYAWQDPDKTDRNEITNGYNHITIKVTNSGYKVVLERPESGGTKTFQAIFDADTSFAGKFGFATDSQPNCSFKNIKVKGVIPKVNITFNGNKGSGSTEPVVYPNTSSNPSSYKVNMDIGTWYSSEQQFLYHTIGELPYADRVGYTFDRLIGWNTKNDGSGKIAVTGDTEPFVEIENTTYYAQWTPINYYVNYILNLPVGCTSTAEDPGDDQMETREMWTFDKERNINYLHWTLKGYHVDLRNVYNTAPNGSGTAIPAPTDEDNILKTIENYNYDKDNHKFTWKESGTSYSYSTKRKNLKSEDGAEINYYVQWIPNSYTIQYKKNTPSDTTVSGSCANTAGTYDEYNTLASGFTAVGYTQTSWNTKANGSGDRYALSARDRNYTSKDGKTVKMYAQWEVNKYNIAFNPNIPSGWPHAVSGSMTTVNNVKWNENKPLPANGYSCTGLVFTGWNTQPNGSGNTYGNGATIKGLTAVNGATVTLYAQWRPVEYYVAYNMNTPKDWPNVGTGSMANTGTSSAPCKYNTPFKLRKNTYAIPGLMFKGWTLKADGSGTVYADQQQVDKLTTVDKSTVTLYAKWEPIPYTVIYKANGGSGADVKETWIYNTFYNLYNNTPQLRNTAVSNKTPHFTNQGYYIDYWTISVTGTRVVEKDVKGNLSTGTAYGSDNAITSATKTHKNLCCPTDYGCVVTLTAHWAPIKYTVTYNNDTSVVNYKGYTASTDTHVTSNYDYDATYDLTNLSCSRSNKYGPSTFLGYGFKNGDTSKNPVWYLAGRSPKKYATGRLSNIHSSQLSSLSTADGTSFGNYFKYVNDGKIQSFNIYAVWDDCPGIDPIDLAWGGNTTDTNSIIVMDKMTNTSVRSGSEAEFQILQNSSIKDSVWDREDNVSSLTADTLNSYYIDNFKQLKIHAAPTYDTGEVLPTSYELKYTVIDANGNKYQTSRKLYVGNTYDIKVGGSALHK